MKISIVIPNYNTGKYLERCLESIFNQSYRDFEVTVVDGYSTDVSKRILSQYKSIFPEKLHVAYVKPNGQSDAINKGLGLALGDIVTYICADDIYEPDCFAEVYSAFINNPEIEWVYGKGKIVDKYDREIRGVITKAKEFLQPHYSYTALQCVDFIVQPTVFIRNDFRKIVGEFNTKLKYTMDYEYWLRSGKLSEPMFINYNLASWRAHGESLSVREYGNQAKEAFEVQERYSSKWLRLFQWKVMLLTNMIYKVIR